MVKRSTRLQSVSICCCIILASTAAAIAAAGAADSLGMTMPHLEYSPPVSYLLPSGKAWIPGQTTMMTALMAGTPLAVRVSLTHENLEARPPLLHLMYKCSASSLDSDFRRILLGGNATTGVSLAPGNVYCDPVRPFTVTSLAADARSFNLTLLGHHQIAFDQALVHSLEFRLHVAFAQGALESRSLFVYNFDGLAKLNTAQQVYLGVPYARHILTDEGFRFVSTLTGTLNQSVESVQLLDQAFLDAYEAASLHIRNTVAVSVLILSQACTDALVPGFVDFVISTGDPNPAIAATFTSYSDIRLHLPTGKVYFSRHALSMQRSALTAKHATSPLQICVLVSINSPVWDYQLTLTVTHSLRGPFAPSNTLPTNPGEICTIGAPAKFDWRILTEGSLDVLLPNQIVCPNGNGINANVYFEAKECTNFIAGTAKLWQQCYQSYSISRTGGAVRIPGPVGQEHSGNYIFHRGGATYGYIVTVIAFPLFRASLPHTTFANLDTQVRLNCTAFHDGMSHVMLEPQFRVLERFRLPAWRHLTLDEFALQILQLAPRSIRQVETKTRSHNSLLLVLPHVNRQWQSWVLTYTCRATMVAEDINKLGLPAYQADTSTDVVYFGERISSARAVSVVRASTGLVAAAAAAAAVTVGIHVHVLAL